MIPPVPVAVYQTPGDKFARPGRPPEPQFTVDPTSSSSPFTGNDIALVHWCIGRLEAARPGLSFHDLRGSMKTRYLKTRGRLKAVSNYSKWRAADKLFPRATSRHLPYGTKILEA
jgi:hypothetical protein